MNNQVQCNFTQTIDSQLRKFWELEEVPNSKPDEQKCEDLFTSTTIREASGRFSVRMPLNEPVESLGDSYKIAKQRFLSLEKRLNRVPEYKRMYSDFLKEYESLGHMTKIDEVKFPNYFLPHHGVFRESSETTKLRVVFQANTPTESGKSLNDIMLPGPSLQNDIFSILLRFRQHKYVACADIEKMFRQVNVQPDQRSLQCIVWRENPDDELGVYQLNSLTYGTTAAPYLSMRCIRQLAEECDDPLIAKVIKDDMYVDDLITGDDDQQKLIATCEKTSQVLNSGCFPLRKWTFNFDVSDTAPKEIAKGPHTQSKTLGLGWLSASDELHFTTKLSLDSEAKLTKRTILSVLSQIYDPLGLLAPAVIQAKILLQQLWLLKIGWDDAVPDDVVSM
ncbi:unnamed protein product [Plutella xylostella]|uniref:(diamondback moth) hypothetical protein n=1 Tax=Plutella xylostella TaxID=51655 RepID=A0A8S4E2N8_PLUXY|nr:unnamed protein product [Plutella xylostella]